MPPLHRRLTDAADTQLITQGYMRVRAAQEAQGVVHGPQKALAGRAAEGSVLQPTKWINLVCAVVTQDQGQFDSAHTALI